MFVPAGGGPTPAMLAGDRGAAGRRMHLAMSSAMMRPGRPDRKKAHRQLKADAMATRTNGATNEPNKLLPKFCMTPILWPRLAAVDSMATNDCAIGSIGPSARPISSRVANRVRNETASPEAKEHSENAMTAISNIFLRLPVRSE